MPDEAGILDDEAKKRLLLLARQTIAARLTGKPRPEPAPEDGALGRNQGAFVTLHHRGALRGCIGVFVGQGSLAETVQEMALSAAFGDPRFPPLASMRELAECDIEISVLSPLKETTADEVEVGKHGICVSRGFNRGVLLPQVATEQGWDKETFLAHCCLKAGLPSAAWQEAGTKLESFTAQVFGEKDFEPKG